VVAYGSTLNGLTHNDCVSFLRLNHGAHIPYIQPKFSPGRIYSIRAVE